MQTKPGGELALRHMQRVKIASLSNFSSIMFEGMVIDLQDAVARIH